MPMPISDTEPGWECNRCGEVFDDRADAIEHENDCEEDY